MKRIYSVMVIKGVMEYVEVHAGGPQSAIRQAERIAMKRPPRASAARMRAVAVHVYAGEATK